MLRHMRFFAKFCFNAQIQHDHHRSDHHKRLDQKRRFKMFPEPKHYSENVRYRQYQTNVGRESVSVISFFDVSVLRNVQCVSNCSLNDQDTIVISDTCLKDRI